MQDIYYKVVCATYNSVILNNKTFVIFTMFFLNLFLWVCQLFGKKNNLKIGRSDSYSCICTYIYVVF